MIAAQDPPNKKEITRVRQAIMLTYAAESYSMPSCSYFLKLASLKDAALLNKASYATRQNSYGRERTHGETQRTKIRIKRKVAQEQT